MLFNTYSVRKITILKWLTASKNAAYMLLTSTDHLYSQKLLNRALVPERLQIYEFEYILSILEMATDHQNTFQLVKMIQVTN